MGDLKRATGRWTQEYGGLRLNWISYTDEETGKELFRETWEGLDPFRSVTACHMPKAIAALPVVCKTLSFSSAHELPDLRCEQFVYLNGELVETLVFQFGFVMPGSTNTWNSTVTASATMIPPEVLSGRMVWTRFWLLCFLILPTSF